MVDCRVLTLVVGVEGRMVVRMHRCWCTRRCAGKGGKGVVRVEIRVCGNGGGVECEAMSKEEMKATVEGAGRRDRGRVGLQGR